MNHAERDHADRGEPIVSYSVIVARARTAGTVTELHVLAVHRDLALEDAMRLLGQRPPGTVGHLRRLPADLPKIGKVLRLDTEGRWQGMVTSTATRRGRRLRDLGGRA
jgi:hypothetical protein